MSGERGGGGWMFFKVSKSNNFRERIEIIEISKLV